MSRVMCPIFFLQSVEASRMRVCYQRGLSRLVYSSVALMTDNMSSAYPCQLTELIRTGLLHCTILFSTQRQRPGSNCA